MMSDEIKTVSEASNEVEDFAALLQEQEQSVGEKSFEKGQTVEGVIVQIGTDSAYVNIGAKAEAIIAVSELMNPEDGKLTNVVGDTIKAKIIGKDGSCIKLSRSGKAAGNIALEEAYAAGVSVKARVKAVNKGGFELDVMGQRAFCPLSQIQRGKVENPEEFVGQTFDFKISKYAKRGRDIVLSRTALMDDENRAKREEIIANIKEGDVLDAKIVSIQDYGIFVDVGGVDGLVHVSELSYQHITNPKQVVSVGQDVKVLVLKVEESPKGSKLSLSMKRLEADPFDIAIVNVKVGQLFKGRVARTTNFGAFVEIDNGLEGLVHISEIGAKRGTPVSSVFKIGEIIDVKVIGIDAEAHRISLSYKGANLAVSENAWANINDYYTVGQEITGVAETAADFGIFVKLDHHITALLPKSEIGAATKEYENAVKGDAITAKIILIDPERKRLTLSTKEEGEKAAAPAARKPRAVRDDVVRDDHRARAPRKDANADSYDEKATFNSLGSLFAGLKK